MLLSIISNYELLLYTYIYFFYVAEQTPEKVLRKKPTITPEDVLTLPKITEGNILLTAHPSWVPGIRGQL